MTFLRSKLNESNSVLTLKERISHDCYQTDKLVIVKFRIKDLNSEQAKFDIPSTAFGVTAKLPVSSASN